MGEEEKNAIAITEMTRICCIVNVVLRSSCVTCSFFWINAAASPMSEKYVNTDKAAETTTKIPNVPGSINIVRRKTLGK